MCEVDPYANNGRSDMPQEQLREQPLPQQFFEQESSRAESDVVQI